MLKQRGRTDVACAPNVVTALGNSCRHRQFWSGKHVGEKSQVIDLLEDTVWHARCLIPRGEPRPPPSSSPAMHDQFIARTIVIAAIDDAVIDAALRFRAEYTKSAASTVRIVDVSRAVAPGQSRADSRGVDRVVLDPAIPMIAEPPLRASALLAEWLFDNIGINEPALLLLPADGGVAHFALAQRAQGIATTAARIGVYLQSEPAIAAVGRDQLLHEVRVLELAETTHSAIARADVLLLSSRLHTDLLHTLGWTVPHALLHTEVNAEGFASLVTQLAAMPDTACRPSAQPHVSVCITHYERPELLQQTLDSIEAQSYPNFDVVLVDDGSDSPAANAMLDSLRPRFDARGWQVIRQENSYLGAARNCAVRHARGEFLLFIDDDDCMQDEYIATFVRAAVSSHADIVTCFLEYFEGTSAPTTGTRVHHRWIMPGPIGAGTLVQNSFGGANALVRRSMYDRIGGYTEDHGIGYEDWEFYNRALAAGAKFEVIPRPLLWCRWGIGGMQSTALKHVQQHARALRPARDAMPPVWRDLPSFVSGLYARNRDLMAHIHRTEIELKELRAVAASAATVSTDNAARALAEAVPGVVCPSDPIALPPRIDIRETRRRTVHVWHTEGLGLSGILSWMWRLRDQFAPAMNLDLRLVDLAVLPYSFQQAGADPSAFYDERVATSQEFLEFLRRTANDVHVVNHAFTYLTSLLEQLGPETLRGLQLIGVCHTDQEFYYGNLEKLAPVLRRIIAVSPTCAATLAARIPQHAGKIVTLPAWALQLPPEMVAMRQGHEPLRLLYTGRILHFQKRVFDLVELATRLRAAKVNATLTIAGDGPDRAELEKRIRAAGARAIPVIFEPARPPWEMDPLLTAHHAFVQVSDFEGASVSLMEALAHGLVPAVTITRSGHDLLESDVNALTAPVNDMRRLSALIAMLARDTDRHQRLAHAARATAETYLAELAYPERFASLVQSVAA